METAQDRAEGRLNMTSWKWMASGLRISVEETWRGDALTGWKHMEVWDVFHVQREQLNVWVDALTELVL